MPASQKPLPNEPSDFSLVLGGPFFHLWQRLLKTEDDQRLIRRRMAVLVLLAWMPLLILSIAEGHVWGSSVMLPFPYDIEMHIRLLIALPLLVVAELVVDRQVRPVVGQFMARGLVPDAARSQFDAAIVAAQRLRDSVLAEVLLIAFVYGIGVFLIWRTQVALDVSSWYGLAKEGKLQPSLAGWWMGCVSLPLFQFLLLRWYFRLFIWGRFLWQVSRIDLSLMPTHPDRCGGLSFLTLVTNVFSTVLIAQGALLAGVMANRIFYAGEALFEFKLEIIGMVALMLSFVLGPLLMFGPKLAAVRRKGLVEYGMVAQRYVRTFDHKWLRGGAPADEPLIGSADIQSLADLDSSFAIVSEMRLVPFTLRTMLQLAALMLLPVAPLLLTMIPLDELLKGMVKIVF